MVLSGAAVLPDLFPLARYVPPRSPTDDLMATHVLEAQIAAAARFIEAVLDDPDLRRAFAGAGYDAAYFARVRRRHERLRSLHLAGAPGPEEPPYGPSQTLTAGRKVVSDLYAHHVLLAWAAFRDDEHAVRALALRHPRPNTLVAWLEQTRAFYDTLLGDERLRAGMARVGVTEDALREARGAVGAVASAARALQRARRRARRAEQARTAALVELSGWLREQADLAQRLFPGAPGVLRKLGLPAPAEDHH